MGTFVVSCWEVNGFKLCIFCRNIKSLIYFTSEETKFIDLLILRYDVMLITIQLLNVFEDFVMSYGLWIYSLFGHNRLFCFFEYFILVYAVYWLSIWQNVECLIISKLYCFCFVFFLCLICLYTEVALLLGGIITIVIGVIQRHSVAEFAI